MVYGAGNVAAAIPRARELLTNIPKPLSNIEVAYTFPNLAQESQIIVGEDVTTVITVRNDAASDVTVKYITGVLVMLSYFWIDCRPEEKVAWFTPA
jgi:hypothetical protein